MPQTSQAGAWAKISDPEAGIAGGKFLDVRPVFFVAHPDDETIGASVALSRMCDPVVVFLTDGAPQDQRFWSPDVKGSREDYSRVRIGEAMRALSLANVPPERVFCLGAIDQEAIEDVPALTEKFASLLRQTKPDVVITHPYEGGHPDHDAAALIAYIAAHSTQIDHRLEILEMASYHALEGQCITGEFLQGSGEEGLSLRLSQEERERKQRMVASHHSQRAVLEGFRLEPEWLRRAPAYDFTQPPHAGKLWYECLGWPITGGQWRQLAAAALSHVHQNT